MAAAVSPGLATLQHSRTSLLTSGSANVKNSQISVQKRMQYVVERCENEWEGVYVEVMKCSAGWATVKLLEAGLPYR